jgi:predicted Zn-dependent protease
MKRLRRGASSAGVLMLFCAAAAGCARNPVTGQLQLALMTEAQEVELGRQASRDVAGSIGLVPDSALQAYIQQLGEPMARASERPDLPWTFGVVDDPTPNAFALPGGFVYFTRGMLGLMTTEAELATVLGHEIGHITARHSVAMISRAQLAQVGLGLGGVLFPDLQQFGGLAGAGLQLIFLRYGRDAERQADELGFRYALERRYDVREMAEVFETLARLGQEEGRSPVPAWLQTHPLPAERIDAVRQRVADAEPLPEPLRVGRDDFLGRIDGLVYGVNPRNGFFREAHYLHPELRFQLHFPAGWQTRNLAQAVIGVSAQRDAALQLTLSADATGDDAARRFLAQQGVQAGRTARQTINGLPAVIAEFRAQAEGQVVQGFGAWIAHGGRVYQLIGYSPVAVYPRYSAMLQQSIGSFAPLTDPAVLAIQPDRIRIVRTPEAMTLTEFQRRWPSTIPLAELATINRLPSADVTIPAGTTLKRVTGG